MKGKEESKAPFTYSSACISTSPEICAIQSNLEYQPVLEQ